MNLIKRMLSLVLALVMVFGVFAATYFESFDAIS